MKKNKQETMVSQSRRDLLKKAAYVPPALVALGALTTVTASAASLGPPPGPPGSQRIAPSRTKPRKPVK